MRRKNALLVIKDWFVSFLVMAWEMTVSIHHKFARGGYGTWGGFEYCKNGVFASGFLLRAQKYISKKADDTGANAVCLKCGDSTDVCSKMAQWGKWKNLQECPAGSYLSGWRQNVEAPLGGGLSEDDTSLNNVEYKCRDGDTWALKKVLRVEASIFGKWSRWRECPLGQFICGINTKVEDPNSDNTGLNDIEHQCCKPLLKKKRKA